MSPEAAAIYGLGETETVVTHDELHNVYHPEDRPELSKQMERCVNSYDDGVHELEHRICLPTGEERWISARKQISFDQSTTPPTPSHATLVAKDITYRKNWEIDVADREAHLRRVIDGTIAFIGVLDPDGTLRKANEPALNAAGLTREDVIGKKFWICIGGVLVNRSKPI